MDKARQPPVATDELIGIWHSKYRYPSISRQGIQESEHFVSLKKLDGQYVFESLPNVSKSRLIMHLVIDGDLATGTWREETDPHGHYKGVVYTGAIQLVIDEDGQFMYGKWVGAGKRKIVNVGSWEFTFVGKQLPVDLLQIKSQKKSIGDMD